MVTAPLEKARTAKRAHAARAQTHRCRCGAELVVYLPSAEVFHAKCPLRERRKALPRMVRV